VKLPTDAVSDPTSAEFFLKGRIEGKPATPATPAK
jgi:hypothetical protein